MSTRPPGEDEFALLRAWQQGDRGAGQALFKQHSAKVSRFFRTKVPESAEDLTQNTFLALSQSGDFRGESSFRAYVFGIARNQLLVHLRSRALADKRFDPLTTSATDVGASPAKLAAQRQEQRLLLQALQRIPVDYQVAVELHYFEGLKLDELAAALETPVGTVKSQLSRARVLLRDALEALAPSAELLNSAVTGLDRWMSSLTGLANDPTTTH